MSTSEITRSPRERRSAFRELLTPARLGIFGLLLVVVGLSWWLRQVVEPVAGLDDGSLRHDPDQYMIDFSVTEYGPQGPRYKLHADAMTHFPDDGTTELMRPTIALHRPGEPPWYMAANEGVVNGAATAVLLRGDVLARRPPTIREGALELRTSDLSVDLERRLAMTEQTVELAGAQGQGTAVGMQADLLNDRLTLNSQVRFRYVPPMD